MDFDCPIKQDGEAGKGASMNIDQLLNELEHNDNLANRLADKLVNGGIVINRVGVREGEGKGKVEGDKNVPPIIREIVGIQAKLGAGQKELEKVFGISRSVIGNYADGRVNTKKEIERNGERESDKELSARVEAAIGKVRDKALERIMESLNLMDGKMESESARSLSQIGSNISRILAATMPKTDSPVGNTFNTVIYSPEVKQEKHYDVIEVGS